MVVLRRADRAAPFVLLVVLLASCGGTEGDADGSTGPSQAACGGDLTGPQRVSEDYLLDLEREAFLSLCGEQKTLERIQYMLENNKPLRN